MSNHEDEQKRVKKLSSKLQASLNTIESDLEREKSISLDSSLNEKRILEEKSELLKTEKLLGDTEADYNENLELSKKNLENLKSDLKNLILKIEKYLGLGTEDRWQHFYFSTKDLCFFLFYSLKTIKKNLI